MFPVLTLTSLQLEKILHFYEINEVNNVNVAWKGVNLLCDAVKCFSDPLVSDSVWGRVRWQPFCLPLYSFIDLDLCRSYNKTQVGLLISVQVLSCQPCYNLHIQYLTLSGHLNRAAARRWQSSSSGLLPVSQWREQKADKPEMSCWSCTCKLTACKFICLHVKTAVREREQKNDLRGEDFYV